MFFMVLLSRIRVFLIVFNDIVVFERALEAQDLVVLNAQFRKPERLPIAL